MVNWTNININKTSVVVESEKSILIAMPHRSQYNGYSFWHLKKLVRDGRNQGAISIGFTDRFVFRLKKYGKGKHNKNEVIDEIIVNADVIVEEFNQTDRAIVASKRG